MLLEPFERLAGQLGIRLYVDSPASTSSSPLNQKPAVALLILPVPPTAPFDPAARTELPTTFDGRSNIFAPARLWAARAVA